ncbi:MULTISPECIES: hypothetical protein [unclassified Streptomyces]|uniref:hypothetical protein n=1 Tax=unclassified Streptomyces TaxID=2593676 RepID=UPI0005AB258B|nr:MULTISPECIES: hypothetical protein [unclassified Streptomyces]MCX2926510.1 hypothetical protein [Streptomyces sp. NEAU-W12]ODA73155.1 hypothetical protein APS67_002777 [Streptomyces sp. AVP053U2]
MPATESSRRTEARPQSFTGVSMRDLLAAGEAAAAISTPPRAPEPHPRPQPRLAGPVNGHREAA